MKRKISRAPEKLAMRFEPDVLVSHAHLANCRPNPNLQPEKRLMLAVLEDAFYCLQKFSLARNSRGKKAFHEAENWLSTDRQDWPFSFSNVCDALGFEANYIRYGLLRWSRSGVARKVNETAAYRPARKKI
jgi:hypothetical protein